MSDQTTTMTQAENNGDADAPSPDETNRSENSNEAVATIANDATLDLAANSTEISTEKSPENGKEKSPEKSPNESAEATAEASAPTSGEENIAENSEIPTQGMGAILMEHGVAFRVWAPHAEEVAVIGEFNRWNARRNPLQSEGNGYWYGEVAEAKVGQGYRFWLQTANGEVTRIDPYARAVTNSVGNGIIHDPSFDWEGDDFHIDQWNQLVIYELHIGSFGDDDESDGPGNFDKALAHLDHLKRLGVNAVQIMPVAEFAGDRSWGYNPAHIFAVESTYGGPDAFKQFIKRLHQEGIAVILDVVYNHFGPSDLDLWRFDGWSENDGGGIYFYQDWKAATPWGHSRPDYGRGEVRRFIHDNAMMWLEEYHVDGLRYDATIFIRTIDGTGDDLPEGWSLLQWINGDAVKRFPGKILIAEDLQNNEWLTKSVEEGGAGFHAQWDASFVHPIRAAVIAADDAHRSMPAIADALALKYNNAAFHRVIYSESHDEVANGKARVPQEISPDDPTNYFAQKRSTLAAALVFTAPGIPMLFQGQEFLQGEWFRDDVPLDWHQREEYRGILRLYRDLIHLRLNRQGFSRGLTGQNIQINHINDANNVIAFRRWEEGGAGDDTMVVVNFTNQPKSNYQIGFPAEGVWKLRLNSDAPVYSPDFKGFASGDVTAKKGDYDGFPATATVNIGPYSALIFSQEPPKKK